MRSTPRWTACLVVLTSAWAVGCDSGSSGQQDDPLGLFPLSVGAGWEYRNLDAAGVEEPLTKEITRCEEIAFVDCVTGEDRTHHAYVQETTGTGATDDAGLLYMEAIEDGIVRVKQDIVQAGVLDRVITYSPFFMRLFRGPYSANRTETFEHGRCEYDGAGVPIGITTRRYEHTIVGTEEVTVPAGTYDAVLLERVDLGDGDTKRYWFADGVGKVKEAEVLSDGTTGASEELVSYTAGNESCP